MSGTVTLVGCVKYKKTNAIITNFSAGDILYRCDKARKGVLEKIAIKRVVLKTSHGYTAPMYIDTLNSFYFDSDLCTHDEAIAAATAYVTGRIADIDRYLSRCQ